MAELTDGVIEWSDPPLARIVITKTPPARPWALIAAQLKAAPGDWALIDNTTGNPSLAPRIERGESPWGPKGAFKAELRLVDGHLHIWARYLGDLEVPSDSSTDTS